jgi:hypothetical protein
MSRILSDNVITEISTKYQILINAEGRGLVSSGIAREGILYRGGL